MQAGRFLKEKNLLHTREITNVYTKQNKTTSK